jgi:DNA-binding GntR family transcriptional regulator
MTAPETCAGLTNSVAPVPRRSASSPAELPDPLTQQGASKVRDPFESSISALPLELAFPIGRTGERLIVDCIQSPVGSVWQMSSLASTDMSPLARPSLAELAHQAIRESILSGSIPMGERIVETRVAEQLGISRAPIREALRRLAEERLVVERPRRGTFVREITASDFIDIYNVRIAIETGAIRLAARRGASTESIEETIDEMAAAAASGNVQQVINLELRVHHQICEASGNEHLVALFNSVAGQIRLALALDDSGYEDLRDIVVEHLPLVEVLRSGDEDAAAAMVQQHILSTVGPVLERLGGDPAGLLQRL